MNKKEYVDAETILQEINFCFALIGHFFSKNVNKIMKNPSLNKLVLELYKSEKNIDMRARLNTPGRKDYERYYFIKMTMTELNKVVDMKHFNETKDPTFPKKFVKTIKDKFNKYFKTLK